MKSGCVAEHVSLELSNRAGLTNHDIDLYRIFVDQTLVERLDAGRGNIPRSGCCLAEFNFDRVNLYCRVNTWEDLSLEYINVIERCGTGRFSHCAWHMQKAQCGPKAKQSKFNLSGHGVICFQRTAPSRFAIFRDVGSLISRYRTRRRTGYQMNSFSTMPLSL